MIAAAPDNYASSCRRKAIMFGTAVAAMPEEKLCKRINFKKAKTVIDDPGLP